MAAAGAPHWEDIEPRLTITDRDTELLAKGHVSSATARRSGSGLQTRYEMSVTVPLNQAT